LTGERKRTNLSEMAASEETSMAENVFVKARSVFVRSLAVIAVIATYAVSNISTQVATSLGISALTLTTTATPAQAGWRRWRWRRWRRCRWGRCW
jgi:hypothetical protein